jgi:hypothetical protein
VKDKPEDLMKEFAHKMEQMRIAIQLLQGGVEKECFDCKGYNTMFVANDCCWYCLECEKALND